MTRIRVLIADDNQAMREVIVSALSADFDVIRAVCDGGAAVAAAKHLLPDVAALDVSMPVLDGIHQRFYAVRSHRGQRIGRRVLDGGLLICQ